jgi:hypothetical protein
MYIECPVPTSLGVDAGDLTGIDVYEVSYNYALTISELEKGVIVK